MSRQDTPLVMHQEPFIIGVRHHSPACAQVVAAQIRALQPRHVLIEGPADFNARLDELYLPHRLPLAIYSFLSADNAQIERRASWTPFSEHSPEWQALMVGREVGAQVHFIDLPAWHDAFADILNRYADATDAEHETRACAYEDALGQSLAIEGRDSLWDHLFEDDMPLDERMTRLHTYFTHLRGEAPGSLGNQAREAMMARWIAWAMACNDGPVVVVCGGYHAPALQRLWREAGRDSLPHDAGPWQPPATPEPAQTLTDTGTIAFRFGSYLVPYNFKRLDALAGYASGMPSPAFHQWVWEHGLQAAGLRALEWIMARLRTKQLAASTADLMAVHAHAQALARLRGHHWPLRNDWLDALAGALLKEALDTPLPWTYRGPLRPGTPPLLVEIMDVLAGNQTGTLAPTTPQPPLVAAVMAELTAHGIHLTGEITLDLLDPNDRIKSRILHRLLILEIPGIKRVHGPGIALSGERSERWQLRAPIEQHAALIEAASHGATLHDAARHCLEDCLRQPAPGDTMSLLANTLNQAAFAGLADMSQRLLEELQATLGTVARFESLGSPLALLHALYRHGETLDMAGAPVLRTVIEAAFDRALWLLEANGAVVTADIQAHLASFQALRDLVADARAQRGEAVAAPLRLSPERALAVWSRKAADHHAAPLSRGAAMGAVLSIGASLIEPLDIRHALSLLASLSPAQMGDALMGLIALAREELAHTDAFIEGVDRLIQTLDNSDFVHALPALRGAFAWLPAQERAHLAQSLLRLHNATHLSRHTLTDRFASGTAEMLAYAAQLERYSIEQLSRWGIMLPSTTRPEPTPHEA